MLSAGVIATWLPGSRMPWPPGFSQSRTLQCSVQGAIRQCLRLSVNPSDSAKYQGFFKTFLSVLTAGKVGSMIGVTRAFTASRLPGSLLFRARRPVNMACKAEVHLDFKTGAFEKELVEFAGTKEYIVKGGRDKFASLPAAFEGISEVRKQILYTVTPRCI